MESGARAFRPPLGLTPFQGLGRCWAEFRCDQCDNTWSSRSSWRDTAQECRSCGRWIYPHNQNPQKLRDDPRPSKEDRAEHEQSSCEKCKQLGENCMRILQPNFECLAANGGCGKIWISTTSQDETECPDCGTLITCSDREPWSRYGVRYFCVTCYRRWRCGGSLRDATVKVCHKCNSDVWPDEEQDSRHGYHGLQLYDDDGNGVTRGSRTRISNSWKDIADHVSTFSEGRRERDGQERYHRDGPRERRRRENDLLDRDGATRIGGSGRRNGRLRRRGRRGRAGRRHGLAPAHLPRKEPAASRIRRNVTEMCGTPLQVTAILG